MKKARAVQQRILALYPKLAAGRICFRKPDKSSRQKRRKATDPILATDRDRVVCALLNKIANTNRAVGILCDAALADDAVALCRVLMEATIQLNWMLSNDWILRVDTYSLFWAPLHRRLAEVAVAYFPNTELHHVALEALADDTIAAVSEDVFDDEWTHWARVPDADDPSKTQKVTLRKMFEDLDPEHTLPQIGHSAYAVGYFHASEYVHSLPQSLTHIRGELQSETFYSLQERPRTELAEFALQQSNVWMLIALSAVNTFTGAGLDDEIDEIAKLMKDDTEVEVTTTGKQPPVDDGDTR